MNEMELRHLAFVRAAAAERQILHHHQQQQQHQLHPRAVVPAFYQPNVVPSGGQVHPVTQLPFAVLPDRGGPALLPEQSAPVIPAYRAVAPDSSDFSSPTAATGLPSRENPHPVDVGERIPVPDSKTRPALTGSRSTTPVKRSGNSFSIDSLLGRQEKDEKSSSRTLEVRKSVADQIRQVDAEAGWDVTSRQASTIHRPISCTASAPVQHLVPGCTTRPLELVTMF